MLQPQRPENLDPQIERAIAMTRTIRVPRRSLSTFGSTVIHYHVVSQPVYEGIFEDEQKDTVVRYGLVRADRPQIVTPGYLSNSEGFGQEATEYLEYLTNRYGSDAAGLLYKYKNEPQTTETVAGEPRQIAAKIRDEIERDDKPLHTVLLGVDELWDVSVMKFIYEFTNQSAKSNFEELNERRLFDDDGGVPRDARVRIEDLMQRAQRREIDPSVVHEELVRWGLFEEYQESFFRLFRR